MVAARRVALSSDNSYLNWPLSVAYFWEKINLAIISKPNILYTDISLGKTFLLVT